MDQQDPHAQQQKDIRDIEYPGEDFGPTTGPLQTERKLTSGKHVEEVPDSSDHDPVPQIPQGPRHDQTDSEVGHQARAICLPSEDVQRDDDRENREHDEERSLFAANTEHGA